MYFLEFILSETLDNPLSHLSSIDYHKECNHHHATLFESIEYYLLSTLNLISDHS